MFIKKISFLSLLIVTFHFHAIEQKIQIINSMGKPCIATQSGLTPQKDVVFHWLGSDGSLQKVSFKYFFVISGCIEAASLKEKEVIAHRVLFDREVPILQTPGVLYSDVEEHLISKGFLVRGYMKFPQELREFLGAFGTFSCQDSGSWTIDKLDYILHKGSFYYDHSHKKNFYSIPLAHNGNGISLIQKISTVIDQKKEEELLIGLSLLAVIESE